MSAESNAFLELVKRRYEQIEATKRTAQETGEVAENLAAARMGGEITEEQYLELRRELLGW